MLKLDAGYNPENILILWKGYFNWQELEYPLEATTTTSLTATNSEPPNFIVSDLTIEPREPAIGELFSISVTVTNTGGNQGNYDVILYIDEINCEDPENITIISADSITKNAIISAGESLKVSFDSLSFGAAIYTATIDGLVEYIEVGC